ncbi:hypothetical protein BJ170DRAFT_617178 [Xylariales sp. AK1849]|nr:hypothetical protein BJ170DRAFT_617178 [Xylariales sp. AK1849]
MEVAVGGGVRFEAFVDALYAMGRVLVRPLMPSDATRKLRVALWNSTVIDTLQYMNTDILWGKLGTGQDFGVFVEMTYEAWNRA